VSKDDFANYTYFKSGEFDSPDEPGSGRLMVPEFMRILDEIRGRCGIPFRIVSGYRTQEHNKKVGGVENSAHTKGLAADIRVVTPDERMLIVSTALKCNIARIGISQTFVHLDLDTNKPSGVMWCYAINGTRV